MARRPQKIQDGSSDDDDAPEIVSHATSKADAKRNQKALHGFAIEERVRQKARNRERDQKLKERAHANRGKKTSKRVHIGEVVGEDDSGDEDEDGDDHVEARMLRAMGDAADEVESSGGEVEGEDEGEFKGPGFGEGLDTGDDTVSDSDAEISPGEGELVDPKGRMDGQDEPLTMAPSTTRRGANYLADDLFAAAFASEPSIPSPQKTTGSIRQQTFKQRRRNSTRPKDLIVGGRTVRMLPSTSDPQSQATARSVPSVRARRFVDQSLALSGKRALLRAKKKGWERRPANVGVMKYQGAPHGFVRNT